MRETDYAFAVAYTRTLENRMLKKSDLEALLNMPSEEDALKYLTDKGYGNSAERGKTDAEALLKNEMEYAWSEVKDVCPKGAPIDILLHKNDFHNLKTILKAVFGGVSHDNLMLKPCTVEPKIIYGAVSAGKPESLPDILREAATEAYHLLARTSDGQIAEIVLDKALFKAVREIAALSRNDFLIGWADLSIAIMNMKTALRGAHSGRSKDFLLSAMLPCGKINIDYLANAAVHDVSAVLDVFVQSGFEDAAKAAQEDVSEFERWCDNKHMEYFGAARYKAFGFEPLLGFLLGKQTEIQSVRIILSGLRGGISGGLLRERMRDLYV